MDPISISGIVMTSLTLPAQIFSSGVVAYTTISQVRHMGTSFGTVYWLFKFQESRYIIWGMSHKACSPGGLDETMMPKIVYETIVQTLVQINTLLEDKESLCARYGLQEVGVTPSVEPSLIRRESLRQQNIVRRLQKSSSLFRKIQWAVRDQGRFAELVQQLTLLINTLYEILPVPSGSFLGDTVAAETLADSLITRAGRRVDGLQQTTHPHLQETRELDRAISFAFHREVIEVARIDQSFTPSPHLMFNKQQLEILNFRADPDSAPHWRSWARLKTNNGFPGSSMMVEWCRYDPRRGREAIKMIMQRRIEALVTMLKEKPRMDSFRVFDCIGYFEDNSDTRFGLAFCLPNDYAHQLDSIPMSLYQTICTYPNNSPYLGDRFRLAYLLAESVHALHATRWLHKGISSHSILLLQKTQHPKEASNEGSRPVSLRNPYFMGFSMSRPDDPDADSFQTIPSRDLALYCHPDVRGHEGRAVARYRAIYDIYSLGTVLIEIGTWRSMARWCPKNAPFTFDFTKLLLDKVVPCLGPSMGENYMNAVRKCLEGSFERLAGFGEDEYGSEDYMNNVRQGLLWEVVTVLRDCRA